MAIDAFILTGGDGTNPAEFVMYRPDLNEYWDFGAQFASAYPGSVQGFASWHYNGVLYTVGGSGTGNPGARDSRALYSVPLPTIWRQSDYAPTWTSHGNVSIYHSSGHTRQGVELVGGKLLLWGGVTGAIAAETNTSFSVTLTSLPTTTFTNLGTIAATAAGVDSDGAVIGNKLYRGGGASTATVGNTDWEVYDTDSPGWSSLTSIPTATQSHIVVTDGTYVYVVGGSDSGVVLDVQRYDPAGNSWAAMTDLPAGGVNRDPGFLWNGTIYAFQTSSTIFTYALSQGLSGSWSTLGAPTNPDGVSFTFNFRVAKGAASDNAVPLGAFPTQGPFDPIRANARMDAVSVATNYDVPPIDITMGQEYLPEPLATIDPDVFLGFDESLTPGTVEFYYLPLPEQNTEYLQQFGGETLLARMGRVYPPAVMTRCQDITSSIITANLDADNAVEARYIIEYVFSSWGAQYPWFIYATVPDLRIPLLGFSNSDYGAGDGVIKSDVIWINQLEGKERTMLDVVQELLAPFGAYKTINSEGELEIRARYGPDASTAAEVTLTDNDLYSLSVGAPSRAGTKNRITTTQDLFDRAPDTPVMQDAYLQVRSSLFDPVDMITDRVTDPPDAVPGSRLDITGGSGSNLLRGYGALSPLFWPASTDVLPDTEISWEDSGATLQLSVDFKAVSLGFPGTTITKSLADGEVTLSYANTVISNGWQTLCTATYTNTYIVLIDTMSVALQARWVNEPPNRRGIELRLGPTKLYVPAFASGVSILFGGWVGTFAFTLSDASTAFTRRGQRNVTFGVLGVDDPDYLPGVGGTNAIEVSQDALGIIEETINVGPYNLSLEDQQAMTEGILIDKIQPRAIRTGNQSVVRGFPIRFSHVGKRIAVPDDAGGTVEGEVVSRSYAEASPFVGASGVLDSQFDIMIVAGAGAGAVDDTLAGLLAENGGYLQLEDSGGYLLLEE